MSVTTAIMLSLLTGAPAVDALNQGKGDLTHARELIKQMGDARFKVRDAAEKELLHLGSSAIEALSTKAKKTPTRMCKSVAGPCSQWCAP
jgi:hypothetical protein